MIPPRLQRLLANPFRKRIDRPFSKRINRAPSSSLAYLMPWLAVMLGSLAPTWPVIASAPVLPPIGFLLLLAWVQMRPGLLPVWAGLPLGLFDDLYSGQPFGSAILLWSLALIGLNVLEVRAPFREFLHEWLIASGIVAAALLVSLLLANMAGGSASPLVIVPQLALSICLFPLVGRLVGALDRFRLLPFRIVD